MDGDLYGTNVGGGSNAVSTAFKLDGKTGILTLLHTFTRSSEYSHSGVVQGTDGNFYGVVQNSATLGYSGAVYQLTAGGTYTELAGIQYYGEHFPLWQLLQHTNGKFYSSIWFAENQPGFYGAVYSFDMGFGPFITFVRARGHEGGKTNAANCQMLCKADNRTKSGK